MAADSCPRSAFARCRPLLLLLHALLLCSRRPHLAGRHFSAVAYLNSQGCSFEGGTFCFQSGSEPRQVAPQAGMLLAYTADDSNVHSVQEVTSGERSTLTMWFTLDPEQREDRKVCGRSVLVCAWRPWQPCVAWV